MKVSKTGIGVRKVRQGGKDVREAGESISHHIGGAGNVADISRVLGHKRQMTSLLRQMISSTVNSATVGFVVSVYDELAAFH